MHASTEPIAEDAAQGEMVLAYFDGDRPVFRPAALAAAEDDAILEDESAMGMPSYSSMGMPSFSAGLPRNIAYEIEDDEPVYRSLGSLSLGGGAHSPETSAMAPPSLCRQRGFGQPGLCDTGHPDMDRAPLRQ
jgi:hypothetical protein